MSGKDKRHRKAYGDGKRAADEGRALDEAAHHMGKILPIPKPTEYQSYEAGYDSRSGKSKPKRKDKLNEGNDAVNRKNLSYVETESTGWLSILLVPLGIFLIVFGIVMHNGPMAPKKDDGAFLCAIVIWCVFWFLVLVVPGTVSLLKKMK